MSAPPDLTVVLSTYNGQKYLRPLLDSVLAQSLPPRLLVRDDGSHDETRDVLAEYAGRPDVHVLLGDNIGVPSSFWALLQEAAPYGGFVAFCDQDDVWLPDKMSRAVQRLTQCVPPGTPGLYCSTYLVTDEELQVLRKERPPRRGPSFNNALVENIVTGCTAVLNPPAVSLIASHVPVSPRMHDWWTYLVVSALGVVVVDDYPSLYYRQHEANVIGQSGSFLAHSKKRVMRSVRSGQVLVRTNQAREFSRIYESLLDGDKRRILEGFLHGRSTVWGRLRYAATGPVTRQTRMDDVLMRLMIVLNRV